MFWNVVLMLNEMSLGRLLTGHSGGSHLVSSPIFVSEISHPDMRGATSNLTMILYTSGNITIHINNLLITLIGFFLSMLAGAALPWRIAAGVFTITGVLSFTLLLFCKVIFLLLSLSCTQIFFKNKTKSLLDAISKGLSMFFTVLMSLSMKQFVN